MIRKCLLIIVLLSAISQMAVTCQGTETGNPGGGGGPVCPAGLKTQADPDADMAVDDLILDLCQRMVACGIQTTIDRCFNELNGPTGDPLVDEFGIFADPPPTSMGELREQLQNNILFTSMADLEVCEQSIDEIACNEVTLVVTSDDFSRVEEIVPTVCDTVFLPSPTLDNAPGNEGCP